ncbi:biotin--protein ligase [Desulfonatronum sp. SC1]|uniref:biotin--protein ligase n=1 Tax=Desulfonatronum sp. SC1 TaxID=2109626 RepID=UPI000D3118EC|nr:biotin--protein ligase [Desulfonatronum sp. SC1]PTN38873.1 biotin--protein ligase [Desulfonatronum sp. SC1]
MACFASAVLVLHQLMDALNTRHFPRPTGSGSGSICLLWDESHLWAILLWRCLAAWGVPLRLARASEIAAGLLRDQPPAALFVPGGWARFKAEALGSDGRKAVGDYLRSGGVYVGLCGGAGLALPDNHGLAVCPLCRKPMAQRLPNFSGSVACAPQQCHPLVPQDIPALIDLPVWWPSQFAIPKDAAPGGAAAKAATKATAGIDVLAAYVRPGPDFWVSDLALEQVAAPERSAWERLYGINLDPELLRGEPCIVTGLAGTGRYILSYAHLETPRAPAANSWLGHMLSFLLGQPPGLFGNRTAPAWNLGETPIVWDDPCLARIAAHLEAIIALGMRHFLLFWRHPWLLGWRRGIPGFVLTTLYAQVQTIRSLPPHAETEALWARHAADMEVLVHEFRRKMEAYLIAERLVMQRTPSSPEGSACDQVQKQRRELIGRFPGYGGLFGRIVRQLDELVWRQAVTATPTP